MALPGRVMTHWHCTVADLSVNHGVSGSGGDMAAARVCSACRVTRLSRFNTGTVCAPCARAARDVVDVTPTWLWDSQPMRQALARLDPGAALAVFRTASGLSQQDVADILGWSQSQVSLIEKGQRQTSLTFANCCISPIWWRCPGLL
jgi:DNA-binding XRE family transcriptional regulator